MKKHLYLNTILFGLMTMGSSLSFAQITPSGYVSSALSSSNLTENPKQAYEFHKEQVAFHKSMADFHKSLAEKYKHEGNYELQRHHKDLATQHEVLSKENDRVARIHEKSTNTL